MLSEVVPICGIPNRRVYDWDEFHKIEGCTIGPHSCEQKLQSFAPSPTVAAINAAVAASSAASAPTSAPTSAPVIRSIEEFNQSNPDAPSAVKSVEKLESSKPQPVPMKGGDDACV